MSQNSPNNLIEITGVCDGDNYWPQRCLNCNDTMGDQCQYDCVHGVESPPFSSICVCDPCYDYQACNVECNNAGSCEINNNGTNVSRHVTL